MLSSDVFFYQFAPRPGDPELLARVGEAAAALYQELARLDLAAVGISEYNQCYLGREVRRMPPTFEDYTHLLLHALSGHPRKLENLTLVDYGGGNGLMSLLAKQMGIGTVIYTDIYDVSCRDAETLGRHLGIPADHYVCGDVQELLAFLAGFSFHVDAFISFNVIEHIYDVPAFLDRICSSLGGCSSILVASCANTLNPRTRYLTMKHQRLVEFRDRAPSRGHKERDSLKAYSTMRKEIIAHEFPRLSGDELEFLARKTRGKMKSDILETVRAYQATGRLPEEPVHPTNTCDPLTGNWDEQLLDPFEMLQTIEKHGLHGQVLPGYYTRNGTRSKRWLTRGLNLLISRSSALGLRVAPHYILHARGY